MTLAAHQPDDATLLRRYAGEQAEEAFAELVRRHISLVHSAALRQVGGNTASAVDVTQAVFTELARQADRLGRHPALTGWLYTITHHLAARHVRSELRRHRREQEAHTMQELLQESVAEPLLDWAQLRPVLDAAMHDLGEADRLAVLLRHFEQRPLAEIGARLGLSENAARMRVDRALDKLRAKLAKRGVTSTAAALAVAMTGQAVTAAPAALTAFVTTSALAAAATTTSTLGFLTVMASTQFKTSVAALLITATLSGIAVQQRAVGQLRADNAGLTAHLAQLSGDLEALQAAETRRTAQIADTEKQAEELSRLRAEATRLRTPVKKLSAAERLAIPPTPEEDEADYGPVPWNQFVTPRMDAAKLIGTGLRQMAEKNGEFPTNSLAAVIQYLTSTNYVDEFFPDKVEKVQRRRLLERFEILYSGSYSNIANPGSAIVTREREAWRKPDGPWMRAYGFAGGGSSGIISSADGDFSAWEAQHQVRLTTTNSVGTTGQ